MRMLLMSAVLFAAPVGASAAESSAEPVRGKNVMTLRIGPSIPLSEIEGNAKDKAGDPGLGFGFEFLHMTRPQLGIGMEFSILSGSDRNSSVLLTNGNTTTSVQDQVFLALIKWFPVPEAKFSPFLGFGLGVGSTDLKMTAAPQSGYIWTATGTSERTTLIDSKESSVAWGLRAGGELHLGPRLLLGGELAFTGVGTTTHAPTAAGRRVIPGFTGLRGASSSLQTSARLSYQF